MGARRLIGVAAVACALVVPAPAGAAPTWHGVDAGVAPTVRLLGVAAAPIGGDEVVVAVGTDDATGQAVVYRLAHGVWQQDALPEGVAPAQLSRVVVGGGHAWALSGTTLLTLADAGVAGPATWSALTTPGELTALAVAPDGSGGFAGAADGRLYRFDGTGFAVLNETQGQVFPPNGGVTAVAASAAGAGVAAAKKQDPNSRFFALSSDGATPQAAVESGTCGADPVAVAAGAALALAIDGSCWWDRVNGVWSQHGTDGAFLLGGVALHDVAMSPDGSAAAIAGESGVGQGTVWRRVAQFGWSAVAVSAAPLRAVSVVTADDMWAVGDGGAVLHLYSDPAPPAQGTSGGGGGGGTQDTTTSTSSQDTSGSTQSSTGGSGRTPAGLTIIIDDASGIHRESAPPTRTTSGPDRGRKRTPARPRRLLRVIRVRIVRHGLRIDFRLAARARVAAVALRGKRTIGRTRMRVFRRGAGRIVLRFKGAKPPTTLRIVARRSDKKGAPARPVARER